MIRRSLRWLRLRINAHPYWARTIFVSVVVGLNVWGVARYRAQQNPRSTLDAIADAIRARDSETFATEADVDSIARSFYDQHILPRRIADQAPLVPGVRERDTASIARRLRRWIETDRIDEAERPRLTLIADFVRSGLLRRSETVESMNTSRTVSIAHVSLTDQHGVSALLELKLVRQQGFWRLSEVTNIEDLAAQLRSQEAARIVRYPGEKPRPLD